MSTRDTGLTSVTRFVLRHRKWVIGFWLVMLVVGGAASGQVSSRLSQDFSLPGQPGFEAAKKITAVYGNGGGQAPSILVVSAPAGEKVTSQQDAIASAFDRLRKAQPSLRLVDYGATHDKAFITDDGSATYALLFAPPMNFSAALPSEQATKILSSSLPSGYQATATGLNELANTSGDTGGPGVLLETVIGGLGALIVLAFVFASMLALLPLLVAAVSIVTTMLITLGLTYVTDISFVVQFLIALVGLGVAIDYSLLVVTRWREERAHGHDNEEAVMRSMNTAGRAVVFSGFTVGIGLLALVVLPVPGLRSIGFGGMLIPLVSVVVTSTMLPAILGGIGPRVDWPHLRHEERASRPWTAWGRTIVRHRYAASGVALVVLAILIIPFFGMKVGETGPDALSKTGPARDAYNQLIDHGVPTGVLTPIEVLVSSNSASQAAEKVSSVSGIQTAVAPTAADSNKRGTTDVVAIPDQANLNTSTSGVVNRVRSALGDVSGVSGVTGQGAIELDYVSAVFDNFPLMLAVVAILTFLLLARAFRSILLPAKAVVLNLASLAATFGLITWFWQEGHGSNAIFGVPATGAITFWVPLMIFAFLFGLSMDYEVFILSRVREEYDRTGSTDGAVIEGLGRTGRLVTSAALILFLAFGSLASAPFTDLKVFATALGAGIMLDATIIRAVLLPAAVAVFGKWNWWMPTGMARFLRVREHGALSPETETT